MKKQAFSVNKGKLSAEIRQRSFLNMKQSANRCITTLG